MVLRDGDLVLHSLIKSVINVINVKFQAMRSEVTRSWNGVGPDNLSLMKAQCSFTVWLIPTGYP